MGAGKEPNDTQKTDSLPKKLICLLASKKLAIYMILCLVIPSTFGMLIPQMEINPTGYQEWADKYSFAVPVIELIGLHNVFYTRWFALISIVFFVNLLTCTLIQGLKNYRTWINRNHPISAENFAVITVLQDINQTREIILSTFTSKGYRLAGQTSDRLIFEKGRFGIWGSLLFHTGLIIIVLGALISGAYKISGYMMVAEGEVRTEAHDNYDAIFEGPFFSESKHYGFGVTLDKQRLIYDKQGQLDYVSSDFKILENGVPVKTQKVEKGHPLLYRDMRFFHYDNGYAPLIKIQDTQGQTVFQTYLLLNTDRDNDHYRYHLENFNIPNSNLTMSIEFYPAAHTVKVFFKAGNNPVGQKLLKPYEVFDTGKYRFQFGEVKPWTGLEVVRDRGAGILFAGCWIALAGLGLLYLVVYRKVQVSLTFQDGTMQMAVTKFTTRYPKVFNEEMKDFVENLGKLLHMKVSPDCS